MSIIYINQKILLVFYFGQIVLWFFRKLHNQELSIIREPIDREEEN